ncbi:MAG: hypothetical protein KKD77_20280 [Gammaproteobacteria bacterium]|nr:hypothetical protein [Gammaproteobacteria bacterium]MBU2249096.1 hypothetical protein [Gammaproteobacteria bacterium]
MRKSDRLQAELEMAQREIKTLRDRVDELVRKRFFGLGVEPEPECKCEALRTQIGELRNENESLHEKLAAELETKKAPPEEMLPEKSPKRSHWRYLGCNDSKDKQDYLKEGLDVWLKACKKAKKRGLPFDLTQDEYMLLVEQPCFYCGGTVGVSGVRLDRVDNSKGYVLPNVVPCCYRCNMVRGSTLSCNEMAYVGRTLAALDKQRDKAEGIES